ncbi:Transposase family Tnp2 protein [Rhizoctonia solani]|uniref:Transposase family Tnp2 protein n=1 Tax=Rhizoctonia solani TaxID=456999 RepID=A0A8H8P5X4_9AGAM|nr:Transposase family Tnp2 protein [Rhizoctonia solani]QRW26221.1 Transposase family Tnp2 protein [Rhizoctonia solani]
MFAPAFQPGVGQGTSRTIPSAYTAISCNPPTQHPVSQAKQLSHVWEEVMQARAPIVLGDQELTADFDSNTAQLSQVLGDIPAPGGSDLDQSADIDGVEYDPATYSLAPQAFVCAPLLVKVAKLAPSTLSPNNLDTIWDFNHFVRQKTTRLLYQANFVRSKTHIQDVFDAILYETLCSTPVVISGVEQLYNHFEDFWELALAIAIDGMGPFKKQSQLCWPILIITYNFPPKIQTHLSNMICTSVIPGLHLPKDLNSFLQPLIDKLVELAQGVKAVNVVNEEVFALCAHILAAFGDLPAMAKLMEFVGHNGRFPCCLCKIMSILGQTAKNGTHLYCPLHCLDNTGLDPHNLPL